MIFTFMGTGTSHGVPVIACKCAVCRSRDRKDKRLRCSAYIRSSDTSGKTTHVVIDTGPEFRIQALKYKIPSLDALFITHSHADHLNGLDDLRIFSHTKYSDHCCAKQGDYPQTGGQGLPVYTNAETVSEIKTRFNYIFKRTQIAGGKPKLCLIDSGGFDSAHPISVGNISVIPVPMMHGELASTGWLLSCKGKDLKKHSIAYLTDCNFISGESLKLIEKNCGVLDHVVIDALRKKEHTTHLNFDSAMKYAGRLKAKHTWFTHICHDMSHTDICNYILDRVHLFPELQAAVFNGATVKPSYDGLVIRSGE
ncbi:MBL fold metallo-hydrolase [Treponema parvum]|uniref:MBL fold metallo-hydrolase n=1 Tax=Treponema parvum TaxID=138851 RepID=UPI001AEBDD61|nr:MBL fold metallo-hydrolase [Treponema parvum]QTQ17168.1 MBL fold metallo-hydrolase [Treponema parvum]